MGIFGGCGWWLVFVVGHDVRPVVHPVTLTLALSHRGRGDTKFCAKWIDTDIGCYSGCQFQSWSAKAKVWGRPPEWTKTTGTSGSRLPARISPMRADMDLPV